MKVLRRLPRFKIVRFLINHKKRIFKYLAIFSSLLIILALFVILNYGKDLASPERRNVQPRYAKILAAPDQYGLTIHQLSCLDGQAPTLVVEPFQHGIITDKARIVRQQLTNNGVKIQPYGEILGNIVILHGRTLRKENMLSIAQRFCAAGMRCIIIDLPAHGDSPVASVKFGSSQWERNLPRAVLLECAQKLHFSPKHSALWGMSMGGSFAISAASEPNHGRSWSSITIVSSLDNLTNVITNTCKFTPITNLLSSACQHYGGADFTQVTPADWAKSIHIPTMVAHGDQDTLIPQKLGKNLYNSIPAENKIWLSVTGTTHHNVLITPMPLYAKMAQHILSHYPKSCGLSATCLQK